MKYKKFQLYFFKQIIAGREEKRKERSAAEQADQRVGIGSCLSVLHARVVLRMSMLEWPRKANNSIDLVCVAIDT